MPIKENGGTLLDMDILNVLLIADDPLARAGLAGLFADLENCAIVGQMSSAELLANPEGGGWPAAPVDLLLWDFGWDPALPADFPAELALGIPILALVADESLAAPLWARGISALLPRQTAVDQIAAAMNTAVLNLVTLHPDFSAALLAAPRSPDAELPAEITLTDREMDVLDLLAEGMTNRAIAQELEISDHTVKFHVNAIMTKLGAQSRTEAVVSATRRGYLSL